MEMGEKIVPLIAEEIHFQAQSMLDQDYINKYIKAN